MRHPRRREDVMPIRVQLSRRKGWKMPPNTVSVARPTRWGNPYTVEKWGRDGALMMFHNALSIFGMIASYTPPSITVADIRRELRGKDLACWCPLDQPCHADVLLRVANE